MRGTATISEKWSKRSKNAGLSPWERSIGSNVAFIGSWHESKSYAPVLEAHAEVIVQELRKFGATSALSVSVSLGAVQENAGDHLR